MEDKFKATLPAPFEDIRWYYDLKDLKQGRKNLQKAVKRTRARWSWFTRAEKVDKENGTGFGTLNYLPYEIREMIYFLVLDEHIQDITEALVWGDSLYQNPQVAGEADLLGQGHLRFDTPMPLAGYPKHFSYPIHFGKTDAMDLDGGTYSVKKRAHIRAASASLRSEFDMAVLRKCVILLSRPCTLKDFMSRLDTCPISCLQRLEIDLSDYTATCCKPDGCHIHRGLRSWSVAFTELPSSLDGLRSVEFVLHGANLGWSSRTCDCMEFNPWRPKSSMARRDHAEMIVDDALVLAKAIRQKAPHARIQMPIPVILEGIEQPDLDYVVLEVIPRIGDLDMQRMLSIDDNCEFNDEDSDSIVW